MWVGAEWGYWGRLSLINLVSPPAVAVESFCLYPCRLIPPQVHSPPPPHPVFSDHQLQSQHGDTLV